MHAPQIIMLAWWACGLGASIQRAIQEKVTPGEPIARLILFGITAGLLWWGGFWSQP